MKDYNYIEDKAIKVKLFHKEHHTMSLTGFQTARKTNSYSHSNPKDNSIQKKSDFLSIPMTITNQHQQSYLPVSNTKNQKHPLFTNNKDNLISKIINKQCSKYQPYKAGNNLIEYNEEYSPDHIKITNPQSLSSNSKSPTNIISLNQNFVNNLNSEIGKYKVKPFITNDIPASTDRTQVWLPPYTTKQYEKINKSTKSRIFTTSLPYWALTQNKKTAEQLSLSLEIKKKQNATTKKIPYIIKCMHKKKGELRNIYFQKSVNKDYEIRYKKNYANVDDILMFHNTFERTGFGKYSIPNHILKQYKNSNKIVNEHKAQKARNDNFGVKWDNIKLLDMSEREREKEKDNEINCIIYQYPSSDRQ